jgi:metal-responsive CopG/Arc/MetJ family transcriptional regulator
MGSTKQATITFKVDEALAEELRKVPNRSEFIRAAILAAMESTCPLCQGTGFLSVAQHKHWDEFTAHHELRECDDCSELHLVCDREE